MEAKQVKGLMEAYASVYTNISESHFKVGDEVVCKASGMEGEIVKVDPEGKGKYYTVKREDGKTMKYAPDELKLDKEEEKGEKEEEGASKEKESEFHDKLDKMVHKTFGKRPEEKKMKEEVETDFFDYILEHLVAEGYADTNKAALAIMANMSEEWKQSIVENRGMAYSGGKPGASGDGGRPKGITGGKVYQMPGFDDKEDKKKVKGV
jgi:preprotein translocase subunit YajC